MTTVHHKLLLLASLLSTNHSMTAASDPLPSSLPTNNDSSVESSSSSSSSNLHDGSGGYLRRQSPVQGSSESIKLTQQQEHQHQQEDEEERILAPSRSRIIGGQEVQSAEEYPFFGYWGTNGGASLVAHDMVLTAAHCAGTFDTGAKFGFGNLHRDHQDAQYNVAGIDYWIHPQYHDGPGQRNDYMLVKLDQPVGLGSLETEGQQQDQTELPIIKPIRINTDPNLPVNGDPLSTIGFGATNTPPQYTPFGFAGDIHYADRLREVEVQYVEHCNTRDYYYYIMRFFSSTQNDPYMCAGVPEGGKDACYGDSGGPLFFKDKDTGDFVQAGVVSWGEGCGDKVAPGVYARVSYAADWIQETICSASDYPPDFCTSGGGDIDSDSNNNNHRTSKEDTSFSTPSSSSSEPSPPPFSSTTSLSITLPTYGKSQDTTTQAKTAATEDHPKQPSKEAKEAIHVHASVNVDLP